MPGRKRVYHSQPPLRAWSETEPPNLLAKGFALDIPSGYGSQKSGARSQNGPCVGVQQTAGFFECAHQRLGFAIAQILGEDQIRSEERRVGKECRSGWGRKLDTKNKSAEKV